MNNMKWISKTLMVAPLSIGLCTSEKAYVKWLKKTGAPDDISRAWILPGARATTHSFTDSGGEKHLVVCMPKTKKKLSDQELCVLVHESVHIWQSIKDSLGEADPSEEFEAYSIQRLSFNLIEAYKEAKVTKK